MTTHPSLSQEKHAIDGLLLLQQRTISQHLSMSPSHPSEHDRSRLVPRITPSHKVRGARASLSEAASSQGHASKVEVITPVNTPTITNPYRKSTRLPCAYISNPYKKSTKNTLTLAQKERIARNRAAALERQQMNRQQHSNFGQSKAATSAIRCIYGFTLSQEKDLVASFIADDEHY
jgi:hypothetical protein